MNNSRLLVWTDQGLYCPLGDFFIDPLKKVSRAVITHAHSDHARAGSKAYLTVADGCSVLRARIAKKAHIESINYSEVVDVNGVKLSFHPAGHVLGSSQVKLEYRGEIWVVSGDYKIHPDPTCIPFEPIRCHTFVTESTFALPIYRWTSCDKIYSDINQWWQSNRDRGLASFLHVYSLGKAQRILASIDATIGPIFVHKAVKKINDAYAAAGVRLPGAGVLGETENADLSGSLVIGPVSDPGAFVGDGGYRVASASGWMRTRRHRRASRLDRGFILSDHADWDGLLEVIEETGAERVIVVNGFVHPLVRWCRDRGKVAGGTSTISGIVNEDAKATDVTSQSADSDFGGSTHETTGVTFTGQEPSTPTVRNGASDTPDLPLFSGARIFDGGCRIIDGAIETDDGELQGFDRGCYQTSFGELCLQLDGSSQGRITALSGYLQDANDVDAAHALRLLRGIEPRQILRASILREMAISESELSDWMYRLCHDESGDLIETISLIVPAAVKSGSYSLDALMAKVNHLQQIDIEDRPQQIKQLWQEIGYEDRMVLNRVIAGGFRVEEPMLAPALSLMTGVDERALAYQLRVGGSSVDYNAIIAGAARLSDVMPHPFHRFEDVDRPAQLFDLPPADLWSEIRWDGIRAQIIRRGKQTLLWSSEGQLLSDLFPELIDAAALLPDHTVIEGDILGWKQADVLPLSSLKRRLKSAATKKMKEEVPVIFMAHDILQERGNDLRNEVFVDRRSRLEVVLSATDGKSEQEVQQLQLFSPCRLQLNPLLRLAHASNLSSHEELNDRLQMVETLKSDGLGIKLGSSLYGVDQAPWFYLRPSPVIVNAALVSVKVPRGENEEVEFTLALMQEGELVPVAKMPSLELGEVDSGRLLEFIRNNTVEKFGPVRVLKPDLIFELACAGIQISNRHKAGLTVRRSKVLRWCGEVNEYPVHSVDVLRPVTN